MAGTHVTLDLPRTGLRLEAGSIVRTVRGREVERHWLKDAVSAEVTPLVAPGRALLYAAANLPFAFSSALLIPSPVWAWILTGMFLVNAVIPIWLCMIRHLTIEFATGRVHVRVRDAWWEAAHFAVVLEGVAAAKLPPVPYEYKTNEELADWDDPSLTVELAMRVRGRLERDGAESLNEPERFLLALYELYAEVNSGGFAGWVSIVDGSILRTTPEALEEIGLDEAATIVREALSSFGEDGISGDPNEQARQVDAVMEEADDLWMRLGRRYIDVDDELVTRSLAYAKEHLGEIREFS